MDKQTIDKVIIVPNIKFIEYNEFFENIEVKTINWKSFERDNNILETQNIIKYFEFSKKKKCIFSEYIEHYLIIVIDDVDIFKIDNFIVKLNEKYSYNECHIVISIYYINLKTFGSYDLCYHLNKTNKFSVKWKCTQLNMNIVSSFFLI
jgi:hypothetical protein